MAGRFLYPALALVPLLTFVAYPLVAMLGVSFGIGIEGEADGAPFVSALSNEAYMSVLGSTLVLCLGTAVLSVAVATPAALFVWTRREGSQLVFLALLALPMFMSYIVKIYTMRSLLGLNGLLNQALVNLGILAEPTNVFLFNRASVLATFVVLYIPFASLPIYLSLERVPANLVDAARDLGASSFAALMRVVLPLAAPGLLAGGMFAFVLALGDFVTPQMVGGPSGTTFGRLIFSQFGLAYNYDLGAALGVILLGVVIALLIVGGRLLTPRQEGGPA